MKRKPGSDALAPYPSEPLFGEKQRSLVRSRAPIDKHRYEDEEVRWLTVIRSRISEAGGKPSEKLLWVGFLD